MAALTPSEYQNYSLLSVGTVNGFAYEDGGAWLAAQLEAATSEVYALLRKRYAVPFAAAPTVVKSWVAAKVDLRVLIKTGVSPLDVVFEHAVKRDEETTAAIRDAVDNVSGHHELVATGDTGPTAAVAPLTLVSSEVSPYQWQDNQREIGRDYDLSRG